MNIKEVTKEDIIKTSEEYNLISDNNLIEYIFYCITEDEIYKLDFLETFLNANLLFDIDLTRSDLERINIFNNINIYDFINIELDNYLFSDSFNDNIILLMDLLNIDLTDIYDIFEDSKDYIKAIQEIEKETIQCIYDYYDLNEIDNLFYLSQITEVFENFKNIDVSDYNIYYDKNNTIVNLKDEFIYNHNLNINNIDIMEDTYYSIFENYLWHIDNLLYTTIKNKLDGFNKFNVNYRLDLY